jgi:NitT/TauT family transport system permease protein
MSEVIAPTSTVAAAPAPDPARSSRRTGPRNNWPLQRAGYQALLVVVFFSAWQYLPTIEWLSTRYKFLNKFYISSPTDVAARLSDLLVGGGESGVTIWPYLRITLVATVVGVAIGVGLGLIVGLIFSNFRRLSEVVRPFIVLANTVPRIALIPIFVVIVGPTTKASILNVTAVVFFLAFFNAFEGGTKIRQAVVDNAHLLGASSYQIMRTIRLPQVLSWTFAVVPNAISFGLIVAVATELIAGVRGVGILLQQSMVNISTDLTFAIIVILSVSGLIMYGLATLLRNFVLRWEVPES